MRVSQSLFGIIPGDEERQWDGHQRLAGPDMTAALQASPGLQKHGRPEKGLVGEMFRF